MRTKKFTDSHRDDINLKKPIDDNQVLNSYYDDRETFVVDYDVDLVEVECNYTTGEVIFKLKKG